MTQCDCKTCATTCKKPKEEDDDRQAAIDFENQIQDLVYVRNVEPEIKKDRAKREVISNGKPEVASNETEIESNVVDNVTQPAKELNTTNEHGEYTQYVKELFDPTKLAIEVNNLRHFTQYSITVQACRKKSDDDHKKSPELPEPENPDPCSLPTQVTITTAKKEDADEIRYFEATTVPSNDSYGIVKVSWKAPENPNGVLLSYTIKYRKNEIENANWESVCIPHQSYLNQTFYLLKPLSNGKLGFVALKSASLTSFHPP